MELLLVIVIFWIITSVVRSNLDRLKQQRNNEIHTFNSMESDIEKDNYSSNQSHNSSSYRRNRSQGKQNNTTPSNEYQSVTNQLADHMSQLRNRNRDNSQSQTKERQQRQNRINDLTSSRLTSIDPIYDEIGSIKGEFNNNADLFNHDFSEEFHSDEMSTEMSTSNLDEYFSPDLSDSIIGNVVEHSLDETLGASDINMSFSSTEWQKAVIYSEILDKPVSKKRAKINRY